jgi:glycosyltransferase involved in cell wall biosynthesis
VAFRVPGNFNDPHELKSHTSAEIWCDGKEKIGPIDPRPSMDNGKKSPKVKVAFVSFDFAEYCVRLTSGIAQLTNILLFLPNCEAQPYLHLLSNSVGLRLFDKPRLRQPLQQVQMVTQLVKQIKEFRPDVIHLQSGHLWFNLALPTLDDYPLVLTVHDPKRHLGGSRKTPMWVLDRACYLARERIVHAPQMKRLLLDRLRIPSGTVHVVPHILIGDEAAGQNVQEEEHLILFFGRLGKYKGLEYLIRAEPLITSRVPQAKIAIAGRGEGFDRYRRMMLHPERFIVYNEYVSDEKRAELFHRASVVVLPYIEASQSGVIPIAYRFAKPVVATTVGGLPAQVDDGKTGYLVPPHDVRALADAIVRLLLNRDLRRQLGANGKRKITVEASPDVIARRTEKVYQLAVNTGHQPGN